MRSSAIWWLFRFARFGSPGPSDSPSEFEAGAVDEGPGKDGNAGRARVLVIAVGPELRGFSVSASSSKTPVSPSPGSRRKNPSSNKTVAKKPEECSDSTRACVLTTKTAPFQLTMGNIAAAGFGPRRGGDTGMTASNPAPSRSSAHTNRYSGCGGVSGRGRVYPTTSSVTPSSACNRCENTY